MSALNRGFDAVAFLDADNWYAPDHIERAVRTAEATNADAVFSDRNIVLSTGEVCPFDDIDVRERLFADTSCFFMRKSIASLFLVWGLMDRPLSGICDRVMFAALHRAKARLAWTGAKTMFYESRWRSHFEALGKSAPEDEHVTDWEGASKAYSATRQMQRLGFDPYDGASPFEGHRFFLVP